jgi:hypothetical protein
MGRGRLEIKYDAGDNLKISMAAAEELRAQVIAFAPDRDAFIQMVVHASSDQPTQSGVASQIRSLRKAEMLQADDAMAPGFPPAITAKGDVRAAANEEGLDYQVVRSGGCASLSEAKSNLAFQAKPIPEVACESDVISTGVERMAVGSGLVMQIEVIVLVTQGKFPSTHSWVAENLWRSGSGGRFRGCEGNDIWIRSGILLQILGRCRHSRSKNDQEQN